MNTCATNAKAPAQPGQPGRLHTCGHEYVECGCDVCITTCSRRSVCRCVFPFVVICICLCCCVVACLFDLYSCLGLRVCQCMYVCVAALAYVCERVHVHVRVRMHCDVGDASVHVMCDARVCVCIIAGLYTAVLVLALACLHACTRARACTRVCVSCVRVCVCACLCVSVHA